jgi:hypothetical protein
MLGRRRARWRLSSGWKDRAQSRPRSATGLSSLARVRRRLAAAGAPVFPYCRLLCGADLWRPTLPLSSEVLAIPSPVLGDGPA